MSRGVPVVDDFCVAGTRPVLVGGSGCLGKGRDSLFRLEKKGETEFLAQGTFLFVSLRKGRFQICLPVGTFETMCIFGEVEFFGGGVELRRPEFGSRTKMWRKEFQTCVFWILSVFLAEDVWFEM